MIRLKAHVTLQFVATMKSKQTIKDIARNAAAADIFSHMATEEKKEALLATLRSLPEAAVDQMGLISGVPQSQIAIYRAMHRNESNDFTDRLGSVCELLQPGDVILMSGLSSNSQALVKGQRLLYANARSSHVALVQANFICIDAMPQVGTTNRLVSEVLANTQDDWRVMRFKHLTPRHSEMISRAGVYYLAQPYSIRPSSSKMKKFSYCSELARKMYSHSEIGGTGIPDSLVIAPADFDRLADSHSEWQDVTELVRPAITFCRQYPELIKIASKLYIDGLKLNRARYEERAAAVQKAQKLAKAGTISKAEAARIAREVKEIEKSMHNKFWDSGAGGT